MLAKGTVLVVLMLYTFLPSWSQASFRKNYFRAPLDIYMILSGNFGELRTNHFHSGIDIKTKGVSGHRVYASAEGYISRIKIEAGGYGNTLYITHPAGYTSVYAHLDRFRKDIEEYVRDQQYSRQQHAVNLFPGKEEWPVEKGELVAYSGTSGYSFGPHLHFEIRDASNQEPMNVLLFGFDIKDTIPPRVLSLYTYPANDNSTVDGSAGKSRFAVTGGNGKYRLASPDTIRAYGTTGFGLEAFDYLNGASNRCGLYRVRMLVDQELKYEWTMERFPFSQARYVNAYIDYEEKARNNRLVQKAFLDPNNKLGLYGRVVNKGMVDFSQARDFAVRFELEDAYRNRSELSFMVRGGFPGIVPAQDSMEITAQIFSCAEDNVFSTDDLVLSIPAGALYRDLAFRYDRLEMRNGDLSPVHCLHDPCTPLHLFCELSIRPVELPQQLRQKALIGYIDEEGEITSAGGEWAEGMITTPIRDFGRYTVLVDTIPPEILPLDLDGSGENAGKNESIRFRVTDKLSGIKSYEGYIDNQWVLFEYDAKNDLVFYRFDPKRLDAGSDHELELYIIDNKENIAYYYNEFYW